MGRTRSIENICTLFIYIFVLTFGKAQIKFELLDNEYHEVIFFDETDVTVSCSYHGNLTIDGIIIEDNKGMLLAETNRTTIIRYRIQRVTKSDHGELICRITLTCTDERKVTEVRSLHLNIQYAGDSPQCFRNGTVGQPYQDGDWILLSCYCLNKYECQWVSTKEGTSVGNVLSIFEDIRRPGKEIKRALVRYNISTDISNRYDCFFPLPNRRGTKRCSIGPVGNLNSDNIIDSSNTDLPVDHVPCSAPTVTNNPIQETSLNFTISSATKVTEKPSSTPVRGFISSDNDNTSFNVAIGVSCSIVLLIIVILFIVILWRKYKSDDIKKSQEFTRNVLQINNAFIPDIECNDTTTCEHSNDTDTVSINGNGDTTQVYNDTLSNRDKEEDYDLTDSSCKGYADLNDIKLSNQDVEMTLEMTDYQENDYGDSLLDLIVGSLKDSDKWDTSSLQASSLLYTSDDDYTEIGNINKSKQDKTISETCRGRRDHNSDEPGYSRNRDDRQQEEDYTKTAIQEDFSILYAKVDRDCHIFSKPESETSDPSDLYAKVDKNRKSAV